MSSSKLLNLLVIQIQPEWKMLRLLLEMNCFRVQIVPQSNFGFVLLSFENDRSCTFPKKEY